jgi:predicted nucleic acid-binding protein
LIVVDASAVAEAVLHRVRAKDVEAAMLARGDSLHAPHFLALEVTHVITSRDGGTGN